MGTVQFGADVDDLVVKLVRGADFTQELRYEDPVGTPADWPVGSVVTLRFHDASNVLRDTWTATIVDDVATFAIDKADVETVAKANYSRVMWFHVNGTDDVCLGVGGEPEVK